MPSQHAIQRTDPVVAYAHDLSNYLTVIVGRASHMLRAEAELPEASRLHAREIHDAVMGAIELIRQVKAGTRSLAPLDLNEFITERAGLLSGLVGEQVRLVLDCRNPLPAINADAVEIGRLLVNLVKNAGEAHDGAGTVVVSTRSTASGDVLLAVEDDGRGMNDVTRRRLLEQGDFSLKASGSGVGMRSVRDIVAAHDAELTVGSEPGQGTRVEVRFSAI